ncbi:MAG TPA: TolC family protein [Terriglobia bacterium]|nr:TolC family protein [Terriglobia bacterium]
MKTLQNLVLVCAVLLPTASCAPPQQYHPVPLSPALTAQHLEERSLSDGGLEQFIRQNPALSAAAWPPAKWDLQLLTLAAFYFSPDLEAARAQVVTAQAAIVTAGMKPNPTLSVSPGIPSPYLFDLSFAIPVVTAGKRRYQIQAARNLSEAARLNLAQTVWTVRSRVRVALLDVLVAERSVDLWRVAEGLQSDRVRRLEKRLDAGETARPAVESARADLFNARLAARAALGRIGETRAALAAAIGIPEAALENVQFDWHDFSQPPAPGSFPAAEVRRDAVLNRLDVRQALAEYGVAESALQLEIARQKPGFSLGPGYTYEQGDNFFSPVLSVTLPIFNRNQGPIAEAEARRKQAADHLVATEARVIADTGQALAQYRSAYAQFDEAQQVLANLRQLQEPMSREQVAAGEADWLSLNAVLLQGSAATGVWIKALFQTQSALGVLEAAMQKPLQPEDDVPPVLPAAAGGKP